MNQISTRKKLAPFCRGIMSRLLIFFVMVLNLVGSLTFATPVCSEILIPDRPKNSMQLGLKNWNRIKFSDGSELGLAVIPVSVDYGILKTNSLHGTFYFTRIVDGEIEVFNQTPMVYGGRGVPRKLSDSVSNQIKYLQTAMLIVDSELKDLGPKSIEFNGPNAGAMYKSLAAKFQSKFPAVQSMLAVTAQVLQVFPQFRCSDNYKKQ